MSRVRRGYLISQWHRELVICAVSKLNGSDYEFHYHRQRLMDAGASEAQVASLSDRASAADNAALFDSVDRTVLRFVLESTRNVKITAPTLAAVRACFADPAQV